MRLSFIKVLVLLFLPLYARADLTIFDVRKNLPMADNEPVYRDFIINGGSESGLSVGMVLTVQRRLPLYDSYQNRSAGDLQLKVAKIKIIYVQKGLAVARLHSEFTREVTPVLEDNYIMIGDRLDLSSVSSGDKKAERPEAGEEPKSSAQQTTPPPQPVAAAVKPQAQIVVNTVELSSSAPAPTMRPTPKPQTPAAADVPVLR